MNIIIVNAAVTVCPLRKTVVIHLFLRINAIALICIDNYTKCQAAAAVNMKFVFRFVLLVIVCSW